VCLCVCVYVCVCVRVYVCLSCFVCDLSFIIVVVLRLGLQKHVGSGAVLASKQAKAHA